METLKEVYYFFYRLWNNEISMIPRRIKWFFQRGRRGYADCDVWELGGYLCDVISNSTKQLSEEQLGCPSHLYDCPHDNKIDCKDCKYEVSDCPACIKWHNILKEISKGFKKYKEDVWEDKLGDKLTEDRKFENLKFDPKITKEEWDQYHKEVEQAQKDFEEIVKTFGKYVGNLWD